MRLDDQLKREGRMKFDSEEVQWCREIKNEPQITRSFLAYQVLENERKRLTDKREKLALRLKQEAMLARQQALRRSQKSAVPRHPAKPGTGL